MALLAISRTRDANAHRENESRKLEIKHCELLRFESYIG